LLAVTATPVNADDQVWTTKVNGVISEMRSGLIMATTSWGTMTIQSDALTEAKVGDEITVWVNENNVVIDAYPKGEARPHHRWVRGNLTYTSGNQEAITLWTPEGKKDFIVKRNRSKFGSFAEGNPITVQLNDKGEVIDVHRQLELELAIAPMPHADPGSRIKLEGVVADIKSGLVLVQTPGGRYTVTTKTAPHDVKVGDKLTLWVSSDNVAVDHHAKGKEGLHRLITGKLTYASGDLKEIKLMTPEGERTFAVQHGESKLAGMKEGAQITIELNEAGNVIEIRKAG
jgi:TusA-related sulfurtransferase